jgi:plastocyanin
MALRRTRLAFPLVVLTLALTAAVPVGAIHLFPLFPGDPGGDCAQKLAPAPGTSAGQVGVSYFTFDDRTSGSSTTTIKVGQSVTWKWTVPYCHSVNSKTGPAGAQGFGTEGGPPGGFRHDQPQLVRPNGSNDSFTVTFTVPGTYEYYCIHHQSVGMVGKVVVTG